jgi:uncharacterized protein
MLPTTAGPLARVFLAGALLLASGTLSGDLAAQDTTLQVEGSAQVEATPDRARISFAVETEAESAQEAGTENARLMEQIVAAVQEADLPGLRVETSGYQLQPRYQTTGEDRVPRIVGYTARNTLRVTVDDVGGVGSLVDRALGAGANRVAALNFELQDPEPYRLEALREAVEKARREAQVMADALGMRLGQPSQVQGRSDRPSPIPMMTALRAEAMADAPSTPVEAGLQTISASVSITYRLHPDR